MKAVDHQKCPITRASKIVGDQWSLLILRELYFEEPRRFCDFEEKLRLSPNTLSARLKKLEQAGAIERKMYSSHPPRAEYYLTEKGKAFGPVLKALYNWGAKHSL